MSEFNNFDLSPKEAIALQKELREKVQIEPLKHQPKLIAGCDVSMNRFAKEGFAGFVTFSYPDLAPVEESVVFGPIPFPYIPGLLSFREIPLLLQAFEGLKEKPDLIIVDGVGIAHPRRLGIATHLGLTLDIPTIGSAKSVLTGSYEEPGSEPGDRAPLVDLKSNETIGYALCSKKNVKPIFVSPGHLVDLKEAVDLVYSCVRKHRLPEPTRLAHEAVNRHRIANSAR